MTLALRRILPLLLAGVLVVTHAPWLSTAPLPK
jgi:hypothetical protein